MLDQFSARMIAKAVAVLVTLETRLDRILQVWLLVAGLAVSTTIFFSPAATPVATGSRLACYILLIVAPFVSILLAFRWFAEGHLQPQANTRLARAG